MFAAVKHTSLSRVIGNYASVVFYCTGFHNPLFLVENVDLCKSAAGQQFYVLPYATTAAAADPHTPPHPPTHTTPLNGRMSFEAAEVALKRLQD
jgi:hypothetical protein